MAVPRNLNLWVDTDRLGRLLGSDFASDEYPALAACPLCGGRIAAYDHPWEGLWLFCQHCGFAGDGIEIAQVKLRLSIQDCVRYLIDRDVFICPAEEVQERLGTYIKYYLDSRHTLNGMWEHAKRNVEGCGRPWREILETAGFPPIEPFTWNRTLGKMAGGIDRSMLMDVVLKRAGPPIIPGKWKYAMILPWYELPGKICGFTIMGRRNLAQWDTEGTRTGRRPEGGLMVFGDISPGVDRIYVFRDIVAALEMQREYMKATDVPASMLVWNYRTDVAWKMVKAKKVIFWTTDPDIELFRQSAMVGNSFISTAGMDGRLSDADTVREWFRQSEFAHSVLGSRIDGSARPSGEAFDAWVSTLDAEKAYEAMSLYRPSSVFPVLSDPRDESHYAEPESFAARRRFRVQGKDIIERDSAWYSVDKYGSQELLSDAIIRIDYVTTQESGDTFFSGAILFRGEEIPFSASRDEDFAKPGGTLPWLEEFLASRACRGFPHVHPAWSRYLFHIAMAMSSPRTIRSSSRVGWNSYDSIYVFPKFSVRGGAVGGDTAFSGTESAPFRDLEPTASIAHDAVLDSDDFENYAALAAPFLYNCTARMLGRAAFKIAVLCPNAQKLARTMGAMYGMDTHLITKRTEAARILSSHGSKHDAPIVFMVSDDGRRNFVSWSLSAGPINCIGLLTEDMARASSIYSDWCFVSIDPSDPVKVVSDMLSSVPSYVAWAQLRASTRQDAMEMSLMNFFQWFGEHAEPDPGIIRVISSRIHYGSPEGMLPAEHRFLNFIFHLIDAGHVSYKHDIASDRRSTVIVVRDSPPRVVIDCGRLEKALRRIGAPIRPPCVNHLVNAGLHIEIDRLFWEDAGREYRRTHQ